jgi:hypothetical protein
LTLLFAITTLLLTPWKGTDLPTSVHGAMKYQLTIKDTPGTTLDLRATHVADGWVAAFCDSHVCMPFKVHETMPQSGSVTLQFELIRQDDSAPHSSGAVIESSLGGSVAIKSRQL